MPSNAPVNVSLTEVESSLQSLFQVLLRGGNSDAAKRLAAIEAGLWSSFQALPKNEMGRLAPRGVRYIVRNYFAQQHGWLIQGLHPHGMQTDVTEMHEVNIFQDKAPMLVESLLEARRANLSLSLSDVVVMVSALENLILDESIVLLQSAYALNEKSTAADLRENALHQVLTSYLMVFGSGNIANSILPDGHQALRLVAEQDSMIKHLTDFEHDAVHNFKYANRHMVNPFKASRYSFEDASQIMETLAHGYGKWQDSECRHMKQELMGLDVDGSGRIPLSAFYAEKDGGDYMFAESPEYLRAIGALDESSSRNPKVRIANYLQGPSNCIVTSRYYSICCLSECEGLMNELEEKVSGPFATPKQLLDIVQNLSSSSVDAPQRLSTNLASKLNSIADRYGGQVALHGRLFAQWMNLAFPNECPFPHVVENLEALTPAHWQDRSAVSPETVRLQHVVTFNTTGLSQNSGAFLGAIEAQEPLWSDEEILPLLEPQRSRLGQFGRLMRLATNLITTVVLVRIAFATFAAASARIVGRNVIHKSNTDAKLPW